VTVAPAFLGRGWSFPPTFDPGLASVVMAQAEADIRQSMWIILSTGVGERVMLPTFGCNLQSMVFTTLTTTVAHEMAAMVTRAIVVWEPRVTVESVSVTEAVLDGWIDIDIAYHVRRTNSRDNLVFPFCRLEATLLPLEV
jgi:hypothetical protein